MKKVYVDSSAYLCVILKEKGWQFVRAAVSGGRLYSSSVFLLEVHRNLVRLAREGFLSVKDFTSVMEGFTADRDQFMFKDVDTNLCLEADFPLTYIPKSLDLIHLRTALWFVRQGIDLTFLTLDSSQRLAAKEMGLKTL